MENLEETVVSVSETLLDSFPVNDPRWAEDNSSNSKTSSLLLTHQLNEKKQKHESYLQFIQSDSVFFKRVTRVCHL